MSDELIRAYAEIAASISRAEALAPKLFSRVEYRGQNKIGLEATPWARRYAVAEALPRRVDLVGGEGSPHRVPTTVRMPRL